MSIKQLSDERIKELYDAGGMVRFSLLSVGACEGKEQPDRINRLCGISNKDRMAIVIEALAGR